MDAIRHSSRYLKFLFFIILFSLPLIFIYNNVINGPKFYGLPTPDGVSMQLLDNHNQGILTVLNIFPLLVEMYIAFCLYRIFGIYERGNFFMIQTSIYIRNVGVSLLVYLFFQPLTQIIMSSTLPHESQEPITRFCIASPQVIIAITGFIVILISWILRVASKINEENKIFL